MAEYPLNKTLISDVVRSLAEIETKTSNVIGLASALVALILLAMIVFTINAVHTTVQGKMQKKQKTTLVISLDVEPKKKKETKKERKRREAEQKLVKCSHGPMTAEPSKTVMFPVDLAGPLPKDGPSLQDPFSYGSTSTMSTHLGNTPSTPPVKTPPKSIEQCK